MLTFFRKFSKSPLAIVLFGLLLLSFAVFGISDVFTAGPIKNAVIQAGSRTVTGAQFKQEFDSYRKQAAEQNQGQAISTEDAVAAGLDKRIIEGLAYTESFAALLTRMGVKPSDKQVVAEIGKMQAFFNPISGVFDKDTYLRLLQQNGLTESQFEQSLRDQIAQNEFVSGLAAGLRAPPAYGAAIALYTGEGRNARWFAVGPRTVEMPPEPTDVQLQAFIKDHAQQFTNPETRQLTVLHFSVAEQLSKVTVNPADIQKRFDFEKDSLSSPERRSFVVIPVKDAAAATAAAARLGKGEDPAAVAKGLGVQPVIYNDAAKTAVPDRAVADAAFAMKDGEVKAPVKGNLGLAAIKLLKTTPGKAVQLDEVRARIEQQVRQDAAVEKVYEQVQKYEDAHSAGANMAEAAAKIGMTPVAIPVPISAQGYTVEGQQVGVPPTLLETAFSLGEGGEGEVQQAGPGDYFVVRVDKIIPSAVAKFQDIKPRALQVYLFEELRKRMVAKAEDLAARVRKGEAIEAAARSVGASAAQFSNLKRDAAETTVSKQTINAIFAGKPGETIVAADEKVGIVVAKIDGAVAGDPAVIARAVQAQQQPLRGNLFSDISFAARNAARDTIKPKVDYDRARAELGLEPEAPAPATKAPAGKAK